MSEVVGMKIPEGTVLEMMDKDKKTYCPHYSKRYVSFGDSIAAGHAITVDWEKKPFDISKGYYAGTDSQFGSKLDGYNKNNEYTVIVANTYTDLLLNNSDGTFTLSFAKSGQTVDSLIPIVEDHQLVRDAIAKANLVTLCIGANEVLQPALAGLGDFFINGYPTLDVIENGAVKANLDRLAGNESVHSYKRLLLALKNINPNATYVFTTVYNPMKYLYLDRATASSGYTDGFFAPLLQWMRDYVSIPALDNIEIFGWNFNSWLRSLIVSLPIVEVFYNRVNGVSSEQSVSAWAERQIIKLNNTLAKAINDLNDEHFKLADTKALFDQYPDRLVSQGQNIVRYNDITNVEFTRGFDLSMIDWGQYWQYWQDGAGFANDVTQAWNANGLDGITSFVTDVITAYITKVVNYVIMPDIDVHPEDDGHAVMAHAFANAFALEQTLKTRTVSFENTNGGGSVTSITVPCIDVAMINGKQNVPYVTLPMPTGFTTPGPFTFIGWNTSASGGGVRYQPGDVIPLTDNLKLYAEWDDMCKVTIDADYNEACRSYMTAYPHTGVKENYRIYTSSDGKSWKLIQNNYLDKIQDAPRTISVKYGDYLRVCVRPKNKATATWPIVTTSGWFPTLSSASESGNVVDIKDRHWNQTLDLYFIKVNVMETLNSLGAGSFWTGLTKENSISEMFVNGKNVKSSSETGFEDEIYVDLQVLSNDIKVTFIYFQTELETTATKLDLNAPVDLSSFGLGKGYIGAQAECKVWDCYISCNNSEYKGCGNTGN